tara:strand:- start:3597 stop:4787 length:1191 start_codon:yes stop_codon:yes gene_type:complete
MKKKILYIFALPYNFYYYKRYALEYIKDYLDVEVLDISQYFFPKINFDNLKFNSKIVSNLISDIKDLKKFLKKSKPSHAFIIAPNYEIKDEIAYICKKESNIKIIESFLNPNPDIKSNFFTKIYVTLKFVLNFNFIPIFKILINKIMKAFSTNSNSKKKILPDIIFIAGSDLKYFNRVKLIKKVINTHSFDYEISKNLEKKNKNFFFKDKIATFLDEGMYHHLDYKLLNLDLPKNPKKYFEELNNFFNFFEEKFKIKVIISLHPKTIETDYEKFFQGRKCLKHLSANLVKESSHVFLHGTTTSLSFPIIFKKPLTFLTTNDLENDFYKKSFLEIRKKILGQTSINLSKPHEYKNFRSNYVNFDGYTKYFRKYIKDETSVNVPLWENFINLLKQEEI